MNDTLSEVVLVPEWRRVVTFTGDSGLLVPGSGYEVLWANLDLKGQDIDSLMFRVVPKDVVVLDSVVSDSRAPVLVYAFGGQRDSVVFTSLYPDTMRYPGIRFRSGSRGSFRFGCFRFKVTCVGVCVWGSMG